MNFAGMGGLFWGISLEFFRDRTALFFTFIFPPIFTVVIAFIIGAFSGPTEYDIGLVLADDSPAAQAISGALEGYEAFNLTRGDFESERQALEDGDRSAVLVIPSGYGQALGESQSAQVEVIYENLDQNAALFVIPTLTGIVDGVDRAMTGALPRVTVATTGVSLRDLDTIDFVGPGILAFSIMQLGVFSAITLVARREKKVLKRVGATPATRSMVLLANIGMRVVIALIQSALQIAILVFGFGLDFFNPLAVIGVLLLGTLVFVGLGFTASSFARTEEAMLPIVQLISLPMFVLAGVFFPLDIFPEVLQWVAHALPLTYLADAVRQLMIDTGGRFPLWTDLVVMVAWVVGGFTIAVWRFRWE